MVMWPILAIVYYRLAQREEGDMEAEFGDAYHVDKTRTGMFLPKLFNRSTQPQQMIKENM